MARELTWLDFSILVAIALLAALNLAVYFGIDHGTVRAGPAALGDLPEGNAPSISERRTAAEEAEQDDGDDLPGRFVPNQGRSHVDFNSRVPFCADGDADDECYASNPPTSGLHYGVQRNVRLADGNVINIPPDPGVYDFEIPRESIPHIQEHAGLFAGHNCATAACHEVVGRLERLVDEELALGARVVMAPSSDLPSDTIALASWTRIDTFDAGGYSDERVRAFIKAHSCRFDPEGFCDETPVN